MKGSKTGGRKAGVVNKRTADVIELINGKRLPLIVSSLFNINKSSNSE